MGNEIPNVEPARRLFTVAQFCDTHRWAKVGGVRSWLFHRDTNGFNRCVRKIGRKLLLDETAILSWIDEQSGVRR